MKKVELVRLSRITQKLRTFQDGGYKGGLYPPRL